MDELGRQVAPLFVHFAVFIARRIAVDQSAKLYFITREGVFFKTLFEQVVGHLGCPPRAAPRLLHLSRIATLLPSLHEVSTTSMQPLWRFYRCQSVRAMLASLHVDDPDLLRIARGLGLEPDEPVPSPAQDRRIANLLTNRNFRQVVEPVRRHRRSQLLAYLAQEGIRPSGGPVVLVDIGWRGTIQDNLAALLPDVPFTGLYLALQQFVNPQPSNSVKRGFIYDARNPDSRFARRMRFVRPLEMLCNSAGGSVVGFDEWDGRLAPRTIMHEAEEFVYQTWIMRFQQAVLDAIPDLVDRAMHLDDATLALEARILAWNLVWNPPPKLITPYFHLTHNEMYGNGTFIDLATMSVTASDILGGLISPTRRAALRLRLAESGWPQAIIKRDLGPFNRVALWAVRLAS
jgi:hypothetical protein